MNIKTNERYVRFRRFLATATNISGLIMLVTATFYVITAKAPETSSLPLVLTGVIFAFVGANLAKRWLRGPMPHVAINNALKGFGKSATLYHYWLPAPHVLVCEEGVFSLTAQPENIQATVEGNHFQIRANLLQRLGKALSRDTLRDPIGQAIRDAERAQRWLDQNLPGHQIGVQPVVVFTNPKASLSIATPPSVPVVHADKRKPSLKGYIRQCAHPTLTQEQIAQIDQILKIAE